MFIRVVFVFQQVFLSDLHLQAHSLSQIWPRPQESLPSGRKVSLFTCCTVLTSENSSAKLNSAPGASDIIVCVLHVLPAHAALCLSAGVPMLCSRPGVCVCVFCVAAVPSMRVIFLLLSVSLWESLCA